MNIKNPLIISNINKKSFNLLINHIELIDSLSFIIFLNNYDKIFNLKKNKDIINSIENINDILNEYEIKTFFSICNKIPENILNIFSNSSIHTVITEDKELNKITITLIDNINNKWWYDMKFFRTNIHNNIYVHCGFHKKLFEGNLYNSILDFVKKYINENKNTKISITGYSYSGAISTLLGYLLAKEINNNITIISFGSPKIGNKEWKKDFESKKNLTHYRITNNRDIITTIPMFFYNHVGINIKLFDNCYKIKLKNNNKYFKLKYYSTYYHNCNIYYTNLIKNFW